jgi:hypothetical protein
MSIQNRTTLKSYFQTGDKPTQAQFENLIDSGFNLSEDTFPTSSLTTGSLEEVLSIGRKVDATGTILTNASEQSIDVNNRYLYDSGAVNSIDWESRYLNDTGGTTTINWQLNIGYDSSGIPSIGWGDRKLYTTSVTTALDWSAHTLKDSSNDNNISLEWNSRILLDNNASSSVDWNSRRLYLPGNIKTVDWSARQLSSGSSGATVLSWNLKRLSSTSGVTLDWHNRKLQVGKWEYDGDYSGTYTSRSIVDKAYVDNRTSSSFFTPGIQSTTNINTSQSYAGFVKKTGNMIDVDGAIRVAATAKGPAIFYVPLPIASTLSGTYGLIGTATGADASGSVAVVTNQGNTARFDFNAQHTANIDFNFHFTYPLA